MKKKVIDINCLSKQQYIKPSVRVVELQQEGQILYGASRERTCDREQGKGTDTKQESQSLRLAFIVAEAGLEHATSRL